MTLKPTIKCLCLLALLLGAPRAVLAVDEAAKTRWSQMSEEDKQRVRENYKRWKGLAPEAQNRLKQNYQRFSRLSTPDRQRVMRRFQQFKSLPPERQQQIRERFQKFMQLSPEERQNRMQKIRERRMNGGGPGKKVRPMPNRVRRPSTNRPGGRGGRRP